MFVLYMCFGCVYVVTDTNASCTFFTRSNGPILRFRIVIYRCDPQFEAQAEELELYTKHNIDGAFETLRSLSSQTTSTVIRLARETEWPAGFINVDDVAHNLELAREHANALSIAYMPKVKQEDFEKWENYSMTHKGWIAKEQPGGPVDVDPIIYPHVWEFADYKWEANDAEPAGISEAAGKRRATEEILDFEMASSPTSLRGFARKQQQLPVIQRPADCTDGEKRRRRRNLANRELEDTDDNAFRFGGDDGDDNVYRVDDGYKFNPNFSDNDGEEERYVFKDDDIGYDDDVFHDYVDEVEPDENGIIRAPKTDSYHTPVWQMSPVPTVSNESSAVQIVNYNLADRLTFYKAVEYMENSKAPVILDVCDQSAWFLIDGNRDILQTVVAYPVFQDHLVNSTIVGFLTAIIPWRQFFVNTMGDKTNNMIVVMNNTCGEIFSVNVTTTGAEIIGEYDDHDPNYDKMVIDRPFARDYNNENFVKKGFEQEICEYTIYMYPTHSFEKSVRTKKPLILSIVILLIFVITTFAFMLFDLLVTKRQNKLLSTALRQNAIVNSLFPKNVQRKLMEEANATIEAAERNKHLKKRNLTTFLNDDQRVYDRKPDPLDSKPIADLFPNTTIMFADISGFTAWSSAREPAAVFTLLETIYHAFDEIAKRRRVFKVEVVGDCYVAVCGLPDPRKDHYAVMCRFAQDCMAAMHVHTKELEVRLGPDTGDLSLRVGLHSGPVVAGVLRGDKSRFQLFGDTMNTASRMESTGLSNRIQLSQATADLLIMNGKEHWITKRHDRVKAKGKGDLTTYFLLSVKKKTSSTNSTSTSKIEEVILVKSGNHMTAVKSVQKRNRVADWVVEMLGKLLKEMKAKRKLTGIRPDSKSIIDALESESVGSVSSVGLNNKTVIDEVADCLKLPGFDGKSSGRSNSTKPSIPAPLDKEVISELQHYVYSVASLYKKNPFHNFEHASHVSMSCIKLLNRIASHDEDHLDSSAHHSYGICSDPLTSFAIVFSALIHDVDHCGVPNAQLVKEHAAVATMYKNKSVAEQNSIDIGWGLLMEPAYSNLRRHIYTTAAEYKCFRKIVVNCIMATDICDKDLIKARNKRWDLAFSSTSSKDLRPETNSKGKKDSLTSFRKATVVIEHLIQLSDVSHTMQHWHMYRRWNERLFEESYKAYMEGRAEKDPSVNWYKEEIGFYDFYIIPLAKKIKQCAVFGVSSDEYLSYALANREEWEERGNEVVKDMIRKVEAIYHTGNSSKSEDSETGADATSPMSKSSKSSSNNLQALETQVEESGASESADPEEDGDDSKDYRPKDFATDGEASVASAMSEVSEDEGEKGSSPKYLETGIDVNTPIPTTESAHSEDSESGHEEAKDLEIGSDGGDTDVTSESTQSKASGE